MDRSEIVTALEALGARLAGEGIEGELYVVGGAAIAIAFDARRATRDVDAVFEPKQEIYAAADAVGAVAEEVYGDRLDAAARFFVEELFR